MIQYIPAKIDEIMTESIKKMVQAVTATPGKLQCQKDGVGHYRHSP